MLTSSGKPSKVRHFAAGIFLDKKCAHRDLVTFDAMKEKSHTNSYIMFDVFARLNVINRNNEGDTPKTSRGSKIASDRSSDTWSLEILLSTNVLFRFRNLLAICPSRVPNLIWNLIFFLALRSSQYANMIDASRIGWCVINAMGTEPWRYYWYRTTKPA